MSSAHCTTSRTSGSRSSQASRLARTDLSMLGLPLTSVSASCSGVSLSSTHSRMTGERTDVTMPLVISQTVF